MKTQKLCQKIGRITAAINAIKSDDPELSSLLREAKDKMSGSVFDAAHQDVEDLQAMIMAGQTNLSCSLFKLRYLANKVAGVK